MREMAVKVDRGTYQAPSNQAGSFLSYRTVYDCFKRLMVKIGAPATRFHDLRHPYVKHTTKIFSLRLKFFQAQPVPDALRKTRGAFLHLREGGLHNPFLQKMPCSLCRLAGT